MIVKGLQVNITETIVTYESGIIWKSANKRIESVDYGLETDHLSAKISILGSVADIAEFRKAIPNVSEPIEITFGKGEKPFGPAFDCETYSKYLLIDIDDIITADMGISQMSFQIAAQWEELPWAYEATSFDLSNFAVQKVTRESEESKTVAQKEKGWEAFRHDWNRPEFTLSLLGSSQAMGGTIRKILTIRSGYHTINCNDSMMLINGQSENAYCTSFGNLRRLGNSGMWQADFNFVSVA